MNGLSLLSSYSDILPTLGFPDGSDSKESAGNMREPGLIPGWEDPLEKGMAAYSSILAWSIPWTEEPGAWWANSPLGRKESDPTERLTQTHPFKDFS